VNPGDESGVKASSLPAGDGAPLISDWEHSRHEEDGMSLTVGTGPLAPRAAGAFNIELPELDGLVYLEPSPRWIRAVFEGETVVDSRQAKLLHEHGRLPVYYFPRDDVRMDLLKPGERREPSDTRGEARYLTLRVGDRVAQDAAWIHPHPGPDLAALEGLVAFAWNAMDEWYEEEEVAIVHPRDPYHRIDVLDTSRHVKVSLDGEPLADTTRARVLFETGLPPRWYIPAEDVRSELLVESDGRTGCAYKGFASYWSVRIGDRTEEDLVWTYREPRREVEPIAGYVAFFNERTDIEVDGEPEERPITPWSPDPSESGLR
jgi:uncharacterized protein (DUF427 family)